MIQILFTECQWGVTPIEGGIQVNLLHPHSKILAQAPFQGDSTFQLIKLAIEHGNLSKEQKAEIVPLLTEGIALPGRDFSIEQALRGDGKDKGGPQG
jgi:hypothetical protein